MFRRPKTFRLLATTAAAAVAVSLAVTTPAEAGSSFPAPTGTTPVLVAGGFVAPLHLAEGVERRSLLVADAFAGSIVEVRADGKATSTATVGTDLGFSPGVTVLNGRIYVARTAGQGGPGEQSPTWLSRLRRGAPVDIADLLEFETLVNPDGQLQAAQDAVSNPYDVLAYKDRLLVVDAAANALLEVRDRGREIRVLTEFPVIRTGACATVPENDPGTFGCDPVPTGVALGRDGYLYVSGLGSEVVGQLWKIDPRNGAIVASIGRGFPTPPVTGPAGGPRGFTDVAVARDGSVYVSSLFTNQVLRLRNGTWTSATLASPTGLLATGGVLLAGSAPVATAAEDAPFVPGAVYAVPPGAFR